MVQRKKRAELNPRELSDRMLKGRTWDEAEETGIEILARCSALHIYARKEGYEYMEHLMRRICERGDEWAHEPGNPMVLALASVGHKREQKGMTNLRTKPTKT